MESRVQLPEPIAPAYQVTRFHAGWKRKFKRELGRMLGPATDGFSPLFRKLAPGTAMEVEEGRAVLRGSEVSKYL